MADDSNIVYRWEIDNATAKHAAGKAESAEFNVGGFRWSAAVEKQSNHEMCFAVRCAVDHNGSWKCDAEVDIRLLRRFGTVWNIAKVQSTKRHVSLDEYNGFWEHKQGDLWNSLVHGWYNIDDTVIFEIRINVISSEGAGTHPIMFTAPNKMSNVVLKIGDERLHVSKEYLSVHSPVFEAMFFGDFAEKGKEEVEIKDVIYKEFLDLLQLVYVRNVEITDRTVSHILKLADQFQIEHIVELCVKHLRQSKGIDVVKKLLLADQYNLASVTDHCLQSFTSLTDLAKKITSSPEYANFSDGMKVAICDRIAKLSI